MTIDELVARCYQQADVLGWHEKEITVPEQVALVCSEACEALEAFRHKEPLSWTDGFDKPQGIASEYADVVIRIAHYAGLLKIDLEAEILRKLDYNMTRGHRHGGKLC